VAGPDPVEGVVELFEEGLLGVGRVARVAAAQPDAPR